jgi:hypothetical protein
MTEHSTLLAKAWRRLRSMPDVLQYGIAVLAIAAIAVTIWHLAALVFMIVGVILVVASLSHAWVIHAADAKTPFLITHEPDPTKNDCLQERPDYGLHGDRQLRVRVTNKSDEKLRNVRARLIRIDPDSQSDWLIIRHDSPPWARSRQGEDVAAGDDIYFDIAYSDFSTEGMCFCYANDYLQTDQAILKDEMPTTLRFRIEVHGDRSDLTRQVKPLCQDAELVVRSMTDFSLKLLDPGQAQEPIPLSSVRLESGAIGSGSGAVSSGSSHLLRRRRSGPQR